MKVTFTEQVVGSNFHYRAGHTYDLPDKVAMKFITVGNAVSESPETTTKKKPRNASKAKRTTRKKQ